MKKKPKKVLIIDDDADVFRLLEKPLKNAGREIVTAFNGEVGFTKAKEERPDVILLDLMLPDIGGLEVAKRLKGEPITQEIPIIFITVTVGVERDKGDETIEIDGCLYRVFAKPLHYPKLLSEIRKSINRRIHSNRPKVNGDK